MKLLIYWACEAADCRLGKVVSNRQCIGLWSRNRRSFQIRNALIESLASFVIDGQIKLDHRYSMRRERAGSGELSH
jgi:hypothetical protein